MFCFKAVITFQNVGFYSDVFKFYFPNYAVITFQNAGFYSRGYVSCSCCSCSFNIRSIFFEYKLYPTAFKYPFINPVCLSLPFLFLTELSIHDECLPSVYAFYHWSLLMFFPHAPLHSSKR